MRKPFGRTEGMRNGSAEMLPPLRCTGSTGESKDLDLKPLPSPLWLLRRLDTSTSMSC